MGVRQLTEPCASKCSVNMVMIIAALIMMVGHIPRSELSALYALLFLTLTATLLGKYNMVPI